MTPGTDLQAAGDRDLRAGLLADHTVTSAIERLGAGSGRPPASVGPVLCRMN